MLWVHPVRRKYYVVGPPCEEEILGCESTL